jgi:signal transduction histidine kinase
VLLQDVDLGDVSREVATVMEPLAATRELRLEIILPEPPIMVHSDPNKLRQVLLNLLGNAVKYTNQGEVRLEVTKPDDRRVLMRVRDTGMGIAPEHLPKIFDPFWQVDPTQRSRDGGTGLGLSVVQRLVRLLSGEISVESVLGGGTTFTVVLPVG